MDLPYDLLMTLFEIYVEQPHIGLVNKITFDLCVTDILIVPSCYCICHNNENLKKFYSKTIIKLCKIDTTENPQNYFFVAETNYENYLNILNKKGHKKCVEYFEEYVTAGALMHVIKAMNVFEND